MALNSESAAALLLPYPSRMMVRLLPIRVGARVRTRSAYPYELPAGLAADQEVLVLSWDPKTYRHVVRDDAGREWTIKAGQNLDAGSEYRVGNRWVGEDHPEVVARLASLPPDDR